MKLTDKNSKVIEEIIFNLKNNYFSDLFSKSNYIDKIKKQRGSHWLSINEIKRLSDIFIKLFEIRKIGFEGEELFTDQFIELMERCESILNDKKIDISIFTKAAPFRSIIYDLKNCGVKNLNIRLDTLEKIKFNSLTGSNKFNEVLDSILLAERTGFFSISIECIVMKGINDNEIIEFVKFVKDKNINIKFIENKIEWKNEFDSGLFISINEIKKIVKNNFPLIPFTGSQNEIANNSYIIGERGTVSFISQRQNDSSLTKPVMISSDGILKTSSNRINKSNMNLTELLRNSYLTDNDIAYFISLALSKNEYKYSELEEFYIKLLK